MYLAEDRILCWELVAKRGDAWVLKFVKVSPTERSEARIVGSSYSFTVCQGRDRRSRPGRRVHQPASAVVEWFLLRWRLRPRPYLSALPDVTLAQKDLLLAPASPVQRDSGVPRLDRIGVRLACFPRCAYGANYDRACAGTTGSSSWSAEVFIPPLDVALTPRSRAGPDDFARRPDFQAQGDQGRQRLHAVRPGDDYVDERLILTSSSFAGISTVCRQGSARLRTAVIDLFLAPRSGRCRRVLLDVPWQPPEGGQVEVLRCRKLSLPSLRILRARNADDANAGADGHLWRDDRVHAGCRRLLRLQSCRAVRRLAHHGANRHFARLDLFVSSLTVVGMAEAVQH